MKSKKTRDKILDASLQLFNEKKASNVSTVQISAAMKISPGNLYYYFANKEEVIRCIWNERMAGEITQLTEKADTIENMDDIRSILNECFKHYEKYRFFYNEMPTLFTNDNEMRKLYDTAKPDILDAVRNFLKCWQEKGKLAGISDEKMCILADNIITLMNISISKFDSDEARAEGFENFTEEEATHIVALIEPYLN